MCVYACAYACTVLMFYHRGGFSFTAARAPSQLPPGRKALKPSCHSPAVLILHHCPAHSSLRPPAAKSASRKGRPCGWQLGMAWAAWAKGHRMGHRMGQRSRNLHGSQLEFCRCWLEHDSWLTHVFELNAYHTVHVCDYFDSACMHHTSLTSGMINDLMMMLTVLLPLMLVIFPGLSSQSWHFPTIRCSCHSCAAACFNLLGAQHVLHQILCFTIWQTKRL